MWTSGYPWNDRCFRQGWMQPPETVNKPTFVLSTSDLDNIPIEARSVGNRFITQIWMKGGQEVDGDESRALINMV
jgi:hypothetical protein